MKSMTGFGRGQAPLGGGHIVIELRTVNHRYLDTRIHLPPELAELEQLVEKKLRHHFSRGRIDVSIRMRGCRGLGTGFDRDAAKALLLELDELRREIGLEQPLSINVLGATPQLFQQHAMLDDDEARHALEEAIDDAISNADEMRDREAEALARDFDERLTTITDVVNELDELATANAPKVLERLRKKLDRLLENENLTIDESRLAQEAAMLAERADVCEELTRLRSHVDQFRAISTEDGPVGRRLDFLLQEMSREATTTGAKTQDAAMQHRIVDLRGELARMREQIQNIE